MPTCVAILSQDERYLAPSLFEILSFSLVSLCIAEILASSRAISPKVSLSRSRAACFDLIVSSDSCLLLNAIS